ncbi:MAG TPA: hypothetical protein VMU77_01725, partial [Acidimicrobiales bacterium]|nr:hypothetical protein [Acidimicrobiales bacterium]
GLVPDGIFGKASAAELDRLSIRGGGPSLMAEVKERELLRQSPRTLDGQTITIGYDPGLEKLVGKVTAILKNVGANVSMDCEPDGSTQAKVANLASASLHLSFSLNDGETGFSMAYYSGFKFESAGGKALAQSIQDRLSAIVPARDSHPLGMALPVLRETRMTAVSCDMGSHVANEGQLGLMAQAIFDALVSWASETWD